MSNKQVGSLIAAGIIAVVVGVVIYLACGICDAQEKIVVQPLWGKVRVQTDPGPYWKGFAKTWAYPRNIEFRYNDDPADGVKEKESTRVTFNDGGTAQISTYIRLQLPITDDDMIAFHQQFGASNDNIKASIKSFMIDCLKSSAPLMSASENQSARKSEYRQTVLDQLSHGLYQMAVEEEKKKDLTDETGQEITIFKTSVVRDTEGRPIITTKSPITDKFKMEVTQFSVTGTEYDDATKLQFAAKKEAFLGAEQAKAERSKEVQERLMIVEKGLREKAEAEAAANVLMATAVIAAEQKANVALQTKIEAETVAAQALSVAEIAKQEAQVKLETAELDAQAIVELAKAEQEKIRLAGAVTELEQMQIDAQVQMANDVSKNLAQIRVPAFIMNAGGGAGGEGTGGTAAADDLMKMLFNLTMMEKTGILDKAGTNASVVKRLVDRTAAPAPAPAPGS
jgi:hypothetical protein